MSDEKNLLVLCQGSFEVLMVTPITSLIIQKQVMYNHNDVIKVLHVCLFVIYNLHHTVFTLIISQ